MLNIPFNKPFIIGKELNYIEQAIVSGKISGNGSYTKKCHHYFEQQFNIGKSLLTSSCTHALEMCAILADIKAGDEVIMPSYTFVSTANAFVLRGAKIIFADSQPHHPNIDETAVEQLITPKTKAIIVVHYGGVACNMEVFKQLATKHNLILIEDAAQAIDSYHNNHALGSIGHLSAFSFHETKNIIAGEGGLLGVNDAKLFNRAEIIWEKGTNRSAFFRGEIDKYNWVDIGSSFLPSEITAAFLYAQLENLKTIQDKRKKLVEQYFYHLSQLKNKVGVECPIIPSYATNNAHNFYLICNSLDERTKLIQHLKTKGVMAVFHYMCLHKSPFYKANHDGRTLANANRFEDCLVRLPLFYNLSIDEVDFICDEINQFYKI